MAANREFNRTEDDKELLKCISCGGHFCPVTQQKKRITGTIRHIQFMSLDAPLQTNVHLCFQFTLNCLFINEQKRENEGALGISLVLIVLPDIQLVKSWSGCDQALIVVPLCLFSPLLFPRHGFCLFLACTLTNPPRLTPCINHYGHLLVTFVAGTCHQLVQTGSGLY